MINAEIQNECNNEFKKFVDDCASEISGATAFIALSGDYRYGGGYKIVSCSNSKTLYNLIDDNSVEKLLDIRVFNKDKEYRLFRSNLGKAFYKSKLDDSNSDDKDYYDDIYYFDIDDDKSRDLPEDMVQTTGGGIYNLPINKSNAGIRIRYYLKQDKESGIAMIANWRIVELVEVIKNGYSI